MVSREFVEERLMKSVYAGLGGKRIGIWRSF